MSCSTGHVKVNSGHIQYTVRHMLLCGLSLWHEYIKNSNNYYIKMAKHFYRKISELWQNLKVRGKEWMSFMESFLKCVWMCLRQKVCVCVRICVCVFRLPLDFQKRKTVARDAQDSRACVGLYTRFFYTRAEHHKFPPVTHIHWCLNKRKSPNMDEWWAELLIVKYSSAFAVFPVKIPQTKQYWLLTVCAGVISDTIFVL